MWVDTYVTIDDGLAIVHTTKEGAGVIDAPVYLFKASGSYLGKYERTDAFGQAEFLLPDQQYKFRVDYDGTQYWSDEVAIIPHEENSIELDLDLLALNLTNDPNPVRFDRVPPEYKPEKVMVASLGSLTGLLTQAVISQIPGQTVYYYINDHLDTPQKIVDENGVVVWSADYKPFGEADVTVTTVQNNLRFPGQYLDEETGLHYNWHRYYHPEIGRYLTPDAIENFSEVNLYLYVVNSPSNFIDPYGLIRWRTVGKGAVSVFVGVVGITGGAAAAAIPTGATQVVGTALVLGGSASFSYGVSQVIAGFLDEQIPFMGTKEAIIKGTTPQGMTQMNLLALNLILDMLPGITSGRLDIPASLIGQVGAYIDYLQSIGKSSQDIIGELEKAGYLKKTEDAECK